MRSKRKGFSVVELIVAISIMAILAAVGTPMIGKYMEDRNLLASEVLLEEAGKALGQEGLKQLTFSFLKPGAGDVSTMFLEESAYNDFLKLFSRGSLVDAFGNELGAASSYDEASLTGTVFLYVKGDSPLTVHGLAVNVRYKGDSGSGLPLIYYVFRN